jgi:phosphatidylglycerophosphate synthase
MTVNGPHPPSDGELWALRQLELLRAARFGPRAITRFLAASRRRSAATRVERQDVARRSAAWLGLGAAAWVALAVGGAQPFRRQIRVGLAWWTMTAAMVNWHLGMLETEDGTPRQPGIGDALTLARVWLVPVAADSPTALVCASAAVTDALDGRLARRVGPTRAGRDFEGLVDACFGLAALRGLTRARRLGRAFAGVEAARLLSGLGYAVFVYFGRARAPERRILDAARPMWTVRFAGLVAAASGRRRTGEVLLVLGSGCSIALTALVAAR